MRSEPIQTYRGVLIYEDRRKATGAVVRDRATVNGKPVDGATLDIVKQAIDWQQGHNP